MACPMGFKAGDMNVPPQHPTVNGPLDEKDSFHFHSIDGVDDSDSEKFEYGLDTKNFNYDTLDPSFEPTEMRQISSEGILIGAGAVAILLQMCHPGVAAGVNRHSNFAYRVQDRLRTTMTFVYAMAFGTPEEKKTIINMVHHAHTPVKGPGYAADDSDAQLWVAATLYATATDVYQKVFGRLSEEVNDRVYEQYAVLATSLRVSPEMWPKNRKAFWEYWDHCLDTFPVTQDAVAVKNDLLYNAQIPWWAKVNMPALRIVTIEWMPEKLREPFGFKKHSKSRRAWYHVINAAVQTTYPHIPRKLRTFPVDYYLKDMRKRMAEKGDVIVGTTNHGPARKQAVVG